MLTSNSMNRKCHSVLLTLCMGIIFTLISCGGRAMATSLGVYFFPGWKDNQIGLEFQKPWDPIRLYPEREPLLSWYQEGDPALMAQQLAWMSSAHIDYVIFDWLWGRDNRGYLEHAVRSYLSLPNGKSVKFSMLWANHTTYIFSIEQLDAMITYWCTNFFNSPDYKKVDGKPVVYIFLAKVLNNNIRSIGMTNQDFFAHANALAQRYGFPGIYFVGGGWGNDSALDYSSNSGYSAFSSYNLHSPATFKLQNSGPSNFFRSYADLDVSYRDHWQWMLRNSGLPYIVPVSSGWDKRPWGGSSDPKHDNSTPTLAEFETHLLAAKTLISANEEKTKNMSVICCWNEYGEGSYIEPTKQDGFALLDVISRVFAD
jgi:hypothetical protein